METASFGHYVNGFAEKEKKKKKKETKG